jgi:hypothetical protein
MSGVKCHDRKVWDQAAEISVGNITILANRLMAVASEAWSAPTVTVPGEPSLLVVSDSTLKYGAYVIMSPEGSQVVTRNWKWDENMGSASIFLKELLAATIAIESIGDSHARVHLLCDNSAAAAVIRRGLSTVPAANEMLSRIFTKITKGRLSVTTIRSEDNAADPLTREELLCPVRMAHSRRCAREAELGWTKTMSHADFVGSCSANEVMARHEESDFIDLIGPERREDVADDVPTSRPKRSRDQFPGTNPHVSS